MTECAAVSLIILKRNVASH